MRIMRRVSVIVLLISFIVLGFIGPTRVSAATTPSLGAAATFGVMAGTYVNTLAGPATIINGDLGYTTLPAMDPTVNGTTYVNPNATLTQARTDAGDALTTLAANPCTETLGAIVDLSTVTGHTTGIYTPGVYCSTGAMTIGTGGITLSGAGTYIFRAVGALDSVANSNVTLANGASSCDVFWTPTAATTLGANTTFVGTIIDNQNAITVGNLTTWLGRALSLGAGSVGTTRNTITTACSVAAVTPPPSGGGNSLPGMITVVKLVINDNGGTKTIADFPLFVNSTPVTSGITRIFPAPANVYTVTEADDSNYAKTFSGDCDPNGQLNLSPGQNRFCFLTNDDIGAPVVIPPLPPLIDVVKVPSPLALPGGPGAVTYTYTLRNIGVVPVTDITMVGDTCSPIVRVSGDVNGDNKLDVNETWVHTCTATLSTTHTNIVTATGWANGISAVDIANATVVVGVPIVPPLIHVVKKPSVFALLAGGGAVTYTYTVTNPGIVPLSNVGITDDKCIGLPARVLGHPGDLNKNNLLESNEAWSFSCQSSLTKTTTNTATAVGYDPNGLVARDFAIATVVVANAAPGLPNTGAPDGGKTSWNTIILSGIIVLAFSSFVLFLKKRTI